MKNRGEALLGVRCDPSLAFVRNSPGRLEHCSVRRGRRRGVIRQRAGVHCWTPSRKPQFASRWLWRSSMYLRCRRAVLKPHP